MPTKLTRRKAVRLLGVGGFAAASTFGSGGAASVMGRAVANPDPGFADNDRVIASPAEALNVFDFEPVARRNVPIAHFSYMSSGIDDEVTLRANREGFHHFKLLPNRLVDVSNVDTAVSIFGERYSSPIAVAPVGGHRAFHPDGEVGVAKAAGAGDHPFMLSTMSSMPIDLVAKARGRPIWFQLYPTQELEIAKKLVRQAEASGATVLLVTVDVIAPRNLETYFKARPSDPRNCSACHNTPSGPGLPDGRQRPLWRGIDVSRLSSILAPQLDWEKLDRIRNLTRMKCVIKGLLSPHDATIALKQGYDGIVVSNHGGRADESGLSTIEALPGIVEALDGRMPIIVDSGFRRGTDIVKALAMGASAVAVGRPYLWGLGAFGETGVARVLEILQTEFVAAMQQVGASSLAKLDRSMVLPAASV